MIWLSKVIKYMNKDLIEKSTGNMMRFSTFLLLTVQYIASRLRIRGFPRLIWYFRYFVIGSGVIKTFYLSRFKIYCDTNEYASVVAISGFVYSRMDRLLKLLIDKSNTFIDIGANVGFISLLASSIQIKKNGFASVHSFEPDPNVYQWLKANSELNPNLNLHINPLAVGANVGSGDLTISARSGWSTMAREPVGGFAFLPKAGKVTVPIISIDRYCLENDVKPSIIKIDVEGLEADVLHGAKNIIQSYRPYLIMEINPLRLAAANTSGVQLLSILVDHNYRIFHIDLFQEFFKKRNYRYKWNGYTEVFIEDLNSIGDIDVVAVPKEQC